MNQPTRKKTGVLLVNLGTPDSSTHLAVARYLSEFLTDKRVIDKPWIVRQLLVHGIIIPSRIRQSTSFYKKIWTPQGSPLKVYGHIVESALQKSLGDDFLVKLAMRYQNPSLPSILKEMQASSLERLIIIPMFPQYSSATTGSVHERVLSIISTWETIPELKCVSHYETNPLLIEAFCHAAQSFTLKHYDHILFSFHGLPQSQVLKADCHEYCLAEKECCKSINEKNFSCYSAQCYATAHAIAKQLKLESDRYSIAFQSRLGKDPWLQPYTGETVHTLAKQGKKKVLVFCPSFVCDCLETTYEIGVEYAEEFRQAGGETLDLVPGLNGSPKWIDTLKHLVLHY